MKKRVVCTLLHERYILPFPYYPLWRNKDTDFICFTEKKQIFSKIYEIRKIKPEENIEKILIENPSVLFPEYQEIIYLKENQMLVKAPWLKNAVITLEELNNHSYKPTADQEGYYIYSKNPVYKEGKYDGRKLLLTIGVPVSNQITVIERCMKGIESILRSIPSELVVIDTGSTDGTVEITKKYGARVFQHPWCDNMSFIRNIAIHEAKGLWYMSIDDDEWFEDVSEIIEFFQSGKYKEYEMASYIQRNLFQKGGKEYSDCRVLRMAKITPELHFEGRIHDALTIDIKREYPFETAAWHEGFAFIGDRKGAIEKSQRNLKILRYDIEEYPMNMRYNYQMANEYAILLQNEKSIAYFFRGISIMRELFEEPELETLYKRHILELLMQYNIIESDEFFEHAQNLAEGMKFNTLEAIVIYYLYVRMSDRMGKPFEDILNIGKVIEQLEKDYFQNEKLYKYYASTTINPIENKYQRAEYHRCMLCAWIQGKNIEKAIEHLKQLELERCKRKDQIKVWGYIINSENKMLIEEAVSHILAKNSNLKNEFWNLFHLSVENDWTVRPLLEYLNEQEIKEYFVRLHKYYPGKLKEQAKKWKAPFTKKEEYLQRILPTEDMLDQAELELLGEKLKKEIYNLIQMGKQKEAKEVLEEYEKICIWDKEIEAIKLNFR